MTNARICRICTPPTARNTLAGLAEAILGGATPNSRRFMVRNESADLMRISSASPEDGLLLSFGDVFTVCGLLWAVTVDPIEANRYLRWSQAALLSLGSERAGLPTTPSDLEAALGRALGVWCAALSHHGGRRPEHGAPPVHARHWASGASKLAELKVRAR